MSQNGDKTKAKTDKQKIKQRQSEEKDKTKMKEIRRNVAHKIRREKT